MKKIHRQKEIRVRCWVDLDGRKFLGPGRVELLRRIDSTGSIARAAKDMGMSYKKAWAMVNEMNEKALKPFVVARKGGEKGGGTQLTKSGLGVVRTYARLNNLIHAVVEREKMLLKLI